MLNDKEMLEFIYQQTDMGREGVLEVRGCVDDKKLCTALDEQLEEYETLRDSCGEMLKARGAEPEGISPMAKMSSQMMAKMKTMTDHTPSKVSEMMIQGNTMGMIQSIKHLHDYPNSDERVCDLANKLLKTEENNIEQMKAFL